MWWKKNKWKVVAPVLILVLLAGAFWYGGGAPGTRGWSAGDSSAPAEQPVKPAEVPHAHRDPPPSDKTQAEQPETDAKTDETPQSGIENRPGGTIGGMTAQEKLDAAAQIADGSSAGAQQGDTQYSEQQGMTIDPGTGKDEHGTDPVPEGEPVPVEPGETTITDEAHTCTISISCASVLDNMDWLDADKTGLIPSDGWLLKLTSVTFYEGESAFNVLQRTCKQQGIHMEFENSPVYNSAYIEGIGNLYEFDCGELSGWMYKVNDWFPNYGCSRYQLHEGDNVSWLYTCDMGVDIGGYYAAAS